MLWCVESRGVPQLPSSVSSLGGMHRPGKCWIWSTGGQSITCQPKGLVWECVGWVAEEGWSWTELAKGVGICFLNISITSPMPGGTCLFVLFYTPTRMQTWCSQWSLLPLKLKLIRIQWLLLSYRWIYYTEIYNIWYIIYNVYNTYPYITYICVCVYT